MRDEDLRELLRAGMEADEPPADLVSERVSSVRARLGDELTARDQAAGGETDSHADADADDVPVFDLPPRGQQPARTRGPWVRGGVAVAAAAAIVIGLIVVATQNDDRTQVATTGGPDPAECAAEVELTSPGALTVATNPVGGPPWRMGDPDEQMGFEHAVVAAVAGRLGFVPDEIDWDQAGFEDGTSPGDRNHDIFIDLVSITPGREEILDLTDPYYDVELALLAFEDSPLSDATGLADLSDANLVAATRTSALTPPGVSVNAAESLVDSPDQVMVFDSLREVDVAGMLDAMSSGSADGMIVDLPSVRIVTNAAQNLLGVDDPPVVALLPRGRPFETIGMVLEDGSPLTRCVNLALNALRNDGTLADLETEWLRQGGTIPTLAE